MGNILVWNSVSLDGVMQGPARPDEDTRGGFEHGGWAAGRGDEVVGRKIGKAMGGKGAFLLGRRTYEDFYSVWANPAKPNPFTEAFNTSSKYVVSNTLAEPLPWANSTLLSGDGVEAVRASSGNCPMMSPCACSAAARSCTR